MPPLKSNPEVFNATPDELPAQMVRFRHGDVAYVKATDQKSGQTFNLFIPRDMKYPVALGGLIIDGLSDGTTQGEYFADSATYKNHLEAVMAVINDDMNAGMSVHRSVFSRLLG